MHMTHFKIMSISLLLALSACGGGGGGGSSSVTSSSGSGSGGANSGTFTLTGTAATGAAIANASINVRCNGASVSTTSSTTGSYSLSMTGATAPCLLRVNLPSGGNLFGWAGTAGVANITTLTDITIRSALADIETSSAEVFFNSFDGDRLAVADPIGKWLTVKAALTDANISTAAITSNPFAHAFSANFVGHDKVLDDIKKSANLLSDLKATFVDKMAQQCSPNNPYRNDIATIIKTKGSLETEKRWLTDYFQYSYLWPEQSSSQNFAYFINDTLPNFYESIDSYFGSLISQIKTTTGNYVDRFSFTLPTKQWQDLSESGIEPGYGIEWLRASDYTPRRWQITLVQPNSPAALAGLQRGDTLLKIGNVDFVNSNLSADIDTINAALFPALGSHQTFQFTLKPIGNAANKVVSLTPSNTTEIDPVPMVKSFINNGTKVGYIAFHDHIVPSEKKLIAGINTLKNDNVTDLVLDLRYNGGGYLYIASQLAYMIAGPGNVGDKYFEKLKYNSKRVNDNNQEALPFYNLSSDDIPVDLPTLNLSKVYILTSKTTCSASESIINSLRGIGVQVYLIGNQTCGKPYGFTGKDNCGISYFPIEFKGVNATGFGDYADGFIPSTSSATNSANVRGCNGISDDLTRQLGDPDENMLKTALAYRNSGNSICPSPQFAYSPNLNAGLSNKSALGIGADRKSVGRQNKIYFR